VSSYVSTTLPLVFDENEIESSENPVITVITLLHRHTTLSQNPVITIITLLHHFFHYRKKKRKENQIRWRGPIFFSLSKKWTLPALPTLPPNTVLLVSINKTKNQLSKLHSINSINSISNN
jgi:hypothetical protein